MSAPTPYSGDDLGTFWFRLRGGDETERRFGPFRWAQLVNFSVSPCFREALGAMLSEVIGPDYEIEWREDA